MGTRMLARLAPSCLAALLLCSATACTDDAALAEAEAALAEARESVLDLDIALEAMEGERDSLQAALETCTGCRGQVVGSLEAYGRSEAYAESTRETMDEAKTWLAAKVKARKRRSKAKFAIVLDIDETALSNFQQLDETDFCYVPSEWDQWVQTGEPKPIPGAVELIDFANANDVAVVLITGRKEPQREDTERALRAAGVDGWHELILRDEAERKISAADYKSARRAKLEAEGFTIVLAIGDQNSDLEGGHAERTFLMPNPFYHID